MLPDAEQLLDILTEQIRDRLGPDSALVGIHSGGAWLAARLHEKLGGNLPLGTLDISFYRDDFSRIGLHPQIKPSNIPFDVEDHHIILIDDVLYTGRTVRAALNELFDYGRPSRVTLAVLVDRGERELPIEPQAIGATVTLQKGQNLELIRSPDGKLTLKLHKTK